MLLYRTLDPAAWAANTDVAGMIAATSPIATAIERRSPITIDLRNPCLPDAQLPLGCAELNGQAIGMYRRLLSVSVPTRALIACRSRRDPPPPASPRSSSEACARVDDERVRHIVDGGVCDTNLLATCRPVVAATRRPGIVTQPDAVTSRRRRRREVDGVLRHGDNLIRCRHGIERRAVVVLEIDRSTRRTRLRICRCSLRYRGSIQGSSLSLPTRPNPRSPHRSDCS